MRYLIYPLILVLLPAFSAFSQEKSHIGYITGEKEYAIGPGDVLEISVWKEEELNKVLTVLPDGGFTFPLIGEVLALGRSAGQIKQELTNRLKRYVSDPIVSVGIQQVNSLLIYVVGKVNNPNMFVLNTRIKVLQALAMAGGINEYANSRQIRIFREEGGKTKTFYFNYNDVSKGENLEQNILLHRGDVIVVR